MENKKIIVKVCCWKTCSQKWSQYIIKRLEGDKKFYNYKNEIIIEKTQCMWNCEKAINVIIDNEKYENQNPIKSSEILYKKIFNNKK